ncbi:MAG TPA: ATP-binding cassette domain-containing protein, partial [Acidimicrobiales bacterium]
MRTDGHAHLRRRHQAIRRAGGARRLLLRGAARAADRVPNGAGKTTAMRAVFGLVALDGGEVRWRGRPIGPAERARFGYMPEERGLYARMQVRDQLVHLGRLSGRARRDVEHTVDAWLDRLGLAARATDRLDTLSHGTQQRVQLV